jgi:predicted TIM-barrel fold metal-dependent hydrolase
MAEQDEHHGHPRYRGPVIDVHVHYASDTRERAPQVNRVGGLAAAIHLWDVTLPPHPYTHELEAWRSLEPALLRCHVPDLSGVGRPGFERALGDALAEAAALGCVGVKVWKNLGLKLRDADDRRVAIDDPRLDALWAGAAEHALPVLIHIGDPPEMWQPATPENPRAQDLFAGSGWWYSDGGYPPLEQLHEEFERLVAGHPATTFVGAHFGCFLSVPELDRWFAAYPNYHLDTSAAISEIGRGDVTAARELFLTWPDRMLFGTDLARVPEYEYPDFGAERRWDLAEYFARHWRFFETAERGLAHPIPEQVPWTVTGIDLPDDVLRALYWDNALRLYRRLPQLERTPAETRS